MIIQCAGVHPDIDSDPFASLLGSLVAVSYMSSMNLTTSLKRAQVKKIKECMNNQKLRQKLIFEMQLPTSTNGKSYRLIVPLVNPPGEVGHFFVGCFDFSMHCSSFFTHVSFYDSLERKARRVVRGSTAAKLVQKVNTFVNNFVLHLPEHHHLQQSDGAVLRTVFYQSCPEQRNGFDCGLFAVAVCLHLAERKPVDPNSFAQCNVTEARRLLSQCLGVNTVIDVDNEELETTRTYFRGCFPLLSSSGKFENSAQGVPPRMATRKSTPSKTRNIRAAEGSQKKKIAVKKVKRELKAKVKTNSDADIVVDKTATTKAKLTKVVPKSPIRKAVEEEHNECDNASIDSLASEEMEVLLRQAVDRLIARGEFPYPQGADVMTRNDSDSEVSKESKEMMTRNDSDSEESQEMMTTNDSDSEVSKESKEMADAVDQVIEAQQLPNEVSNELVINTMSTSSKTEDSSALTGASSDTTFYKVMAEAKIDSFAEMDHINPLVEIYEQKTGNHLRIKRSINGKFRVYQCREHINCPFEIRFSRRRSDGMYTVSKMKTRHAEVRRPPLAADGRKWKTRYSSKMLNDAITKVLKNKHVAPTARDVVKTLANNKNNSQVVSYNTAWRAVNRDTMVTKRLGYKSFQLVGPYTEELARTNPGSVLGFLRLPTFELQSVHFFPGFMNTALKFVRPVISLDAAHLRSEFKGTLYVASVLTGNNDVFPIGFMIAAGNEDGETWIQMLTYLKEACPIICQQGGAHQPMADDNAQLCETPFVFVSDRDKGLKEAVKRVFPTNLEFSCAQHIRANVTQRFGRNASKYVMAIAKTYSARYVELLMDKTKRVKPQAAKYIQDIEEGGVLWKSSQWLSRQHQYPPRFGIVTSNTSESVNSMFTGARDLPWMGAFEHLVNLLSSRICKLRTVYSKHDGGDVVPRVKKLLKARWEKAASMTVLEVEEDCGHFEVVSPEYGDPEDADIGDIIVGVDVPNVQLNLHMVKPEQRWCSCGAWQDCMIPCRHAMAVYRLHKGNDLTYIQSELVGDYHKFGYVQKTLKQNVYPVSTDSLKSDGITLPPIVKKRGAGRPKTKRIRHRSEYQMGDDSPIICSNCRRRGHNKRTCPNPQNATESGTGNNVEGSSSDEDDMEQEERQQEDQESDDSSENGNQSGNEGSVDNKTE